ncbi:hypothetical protein C2E25_10390 [Geothermobacter hydrogeniphilus]|uniref:GspL periplasmic domain-containing protein n=1 Tax=Geothermobacter hydrogeniphilus TaxID=1969733 RepID=A0A2K2H940_9BACT|nr:type II secretion system protein GspL [Geothermobacter hydrogeniphilus]PNU19832.1 hypothetical protein C2E25_10390 [Geothermobacter hydrogeniphilus]
MRRKIIALDTSVTPWQLAVAGSVRGGTRLDQLAELDRDPQRPLDEQLREALGCPLDAGDRLAVCLPASSALIRWLDFPFHDTRKIAAATPAELSCQLPCELDDYQVRQVRLNAAPAAENTILAAALPTTVIEQLLDPFDDDREPLGFIGLAPFAWHDGLADQLNDGLLVCVSGSEISLALSRDGVLQDLRVRPRLGDQRSIDQVEFILRQGRILLGNCPGQRNVMLLGEEADSELAAALRAAGMEVATPQLDCAGNRVPAGQLPAAALALGIAGQKNAGLNFRSGSFALKNEWQALKRRLLGAAALLTATLLLLGAGAGVQYHQRSNRLVQLKQAMRQQYLQTFPGEKAIVDVPLQLQAKIRELQKKQSRLGTGNSSALQVLKEVSARCPTKFKLDIREYSYSPTGLRLGGSTDSFDAVTQIARSLKTSPLFSEVKISDTKQKSSDERVEFRLQLSFAAPGGAS